ncbi:unnamed protein product [Phaedon cochleariae]|uniref:Ribosomal protein eL8/eL30/eS12/Gadd45 domain-containing protein n=1 Tax=Phaedon cochleariae TaxID=80249 RepID=A0A9P0DCM2_PHACE|nr:unnamed protein product [Phaedon cochleariae]
MKESGWVGHRARDLSIFWILIWNSKSMDTPVLNKKQQKASLSAKKNRPKETIKNVLATPFNNNFWPEISQHDNKVLHKVLMANLPQIKEVKVNVPWNELKDIPKSDRKEFRAHYSKKMTGQHIDKEGSTGLSLGVNNVTKQLENNSASSVLITSDVLPRIMVQHLVDMAVLKNIPILAVDNLRSLLKTQCGIGSVALAIHREIPTESKLNLIKDLVHTLFTTCSVPVNHINYKRSIDNHVAAHPQPNITKQKEPKIPVDENAIRQLVHLKRQNQHSRTFKPELSTIDKKVTKLQVDETGFLAFSDDPVEEKPLKHYKSLIVKRLRGDKNRNKRKMKSLKDG